MSTRPTPNPNAASGSIARLRDASFRTARPLAGRIVGLLLSAALIVPVLAPGGSEAVALPSAGLVPSGSWLICGRNAYPELRFTFVGRMPVGTKTYTVQSGEAFGYGEFCYIDPEDRLFRLYDISMHAQTSIGTVEWSCVGPMGIGLNRPNPDLGEDFDGIAVYDARCRTIGRSGHFLLRVAFAVRKLHSYYDSEFHRYDFVGGAYTALVTGA